MQRAIVNYYRGLFDEVKSTRSYWKLLKKAMDVKKGCNISGMRKADGSLAIDNKEKADTLNEYFANVGENLASSLLQNGNYTNTVNKVTRTIMRIELTQDMVYKEILKLKPNKARGPDNISPKLLKLADKSIVPSLTSIFKISAQTNKVPRKCKNANVTAIFKKDDEAERENYRPISILCVPGKIMESCTTTTIYDHLEEHNLSNKHQWAYKKGHSTELLLVKMTEDWRTALDNKLVVGIVFIDFKKTFDSVSHFLLLQKLQSLG